MSIQEIVGVPVLWGEPDATDLWTPPQYSVENLGETVAPIYVEIPVVHVRNKTVNDRRPGPHREPEGSLPREKG